MSVFDWLEKNSAVADAMFGSVLPAVATQFLVDKPQTIDPNAIANLYKVMAQGAVDANQFAKIQQQFYTQNFMPAAQAIAGRAAGMGVGQDLAQSADRAIADVDSGTRTQLGTFDREMASRGVDPTSSAAIAGRARIQDGATLNRVDAANRAMRSREEQGDAARVQAAGLLNTKPDFSTGAYIAQGAGGSLNNLNNSLNAQYNQEVSDTAYALSSPWDTYRRSQRQQKYDQWRQQATDRIGSILGSDVK